MDEQMQCVFVANGEIHAQQVRAFLEAAGIPTPSCMAKRSVILMG